MLHRIAMGAVLAGAGASAALAKPETIQRTGPAEAAIAATVSLPRDARLVYISGTVPEAVSPGAPQGSVERYGDTEAQTRSVLGKIQKSLSELGLGMGDVVMMRVFLVAPPGQPRMDFAGLMRGYRAYFATPQQPLKPARSTMQVAGLVDPGFLVEIEVTAARR
jgi:enamine deaminase RidA (YjgF/YER057c/UK114 family)